MQGSCCDRRPEAAARGNGMYRQRALLLDARIEPKHDTRGEGPRAEQPDRANAVRIGVVAAELLGGEAVPHRRYLDFVADIPPVVLRVQRDPAAHGSLPPERGPAFCLTVVKAVATAETRGEPVTEPSRHPSA